MLRSICDVEVGKIKGRWKAPYLSLLGELVETCSSRGSRPQVAPWFQTYFRNVYYFITEAFAYSMLCIGQIEASTCTPRATPRAFVFFENYRSNSPLPGQNAVQMPHTGVHSGDQMPPPRGHFTSTRMTEGRRKRLQLSNKSL